MLAGNLGATVLEGLSSVIIKAAELHLILSQAVITSPTYLPSRNAFTWLTVGVGCLKGVLHSLATILHGPSRWPFQKEKPRLHNIWLNYVNYLRWQENLWKQTHGFFRKQAGSTGSPGKRTYETKTRQILSFCSYNFPFLCFSSGVLEGMGLYTPYMLFQLRHQEGTNPSALLRFQKNLWDGAVVSTTESFVYNCVSGGNRRG